MEDKNIEEMKKPCMHCPKIDVEGLIAKGKQFDLDITLPDVNVKRYQKKRETKLLHLISLISFI